MTKKAKNKASKSGAANTAAPEPSSMNPAQACALLDYAKGVTPIEEIMAPKFWDNPPTSGREFNSFRREGRRAIYRIIKYKRLGKPYMDDPKLAEMHEIISGHICPNNGITWANFASRWDLHPKDIKKIVLKEHWLKEGGGFDTELGTHSPTAFTEQLQ